VIAQADIVHGDGAHRCPERSGIFVSLRNIADSGKRKRNDAVNAMM
jgi:hypothetical protein